MKIEIELDLLIALILHGKGSKTLTHFSLEDTYFQRALDLLQLIQILDNEENLVHIEFFKTPDNELRSTIWDIRDWKISEERYNKQKEWSEERIREYEKQKKQIVSLEDKIMEKLETKNRDNPAIKEIVKIYLKTGNQDILKMLGIESLE